MKRSFGLLLGVMLSIVSQSSFSALVFNFSYADAATNIGFGTGNTNGVARRTALESAASSLGAYFGNNRTLNITIAASQTDGTGFLASAGTSYSLINSSFQQGFAQKEVLTGGTGSGSQHGLMTWDFGRSYDLDDSVSAGTYDFKSIAIHELTHVLGFSSLIGSSGETRLGGGAVNIWSDYDQYLVDGAGGNLIDSMTKDFINAQTADLTGGSGTSPASTNTGVYFNGANAVAANGGNLVPIYSPASFASGSSLSHLDTDFFGANNYVMTHSLTTGQSVRALSDIEIGVFQDLGYTVSAAPLPAAFWLFTSGLLMLFRMKKHSIVK